MKTLALLLPVVVLGCSSNPEGGPQASSHRIDLENPPQSALAALVRSLEVVDAMQQPDVEIRVRAVECDSMMDRRKQTEFVRVVLDVTVLAERYEIAERVFESLTEALAAEGEAVQRADSAAFGRVERVFESMDWAATELEERRYVRMVSVSDSIRVEVRAPVTSGSIVPGGDSAPPESEAVSEYIRRLASDERAAIGPVETDVEVYHPRTGKRDLRYRIRPEKPRGPYTRGQIGTFLYLLESESPALRVTHVTIGPFQPGSDVQEDLWTFQADVSVRTPDV